MPRRRGRDPVGGRDWARLSASSRDAHHRAMRALSYMRTEGLTLSTAAELAGTTPATVRRYAGPALTQAGNRYQMTAADRLYRRMAVYGPHGRTEVDVRGSRAASLIGAHFNAVGRYLATGDAGVLTPFRGRSVLDVLGLPIRPARAFSPASLSKAVLDALGVTPHARRDTRRGA